MTGPNPPISFQADLKAYDSALRVRYGHRTGLWIIERKLPERHRQLLAEKPNPWKSPRGFDLWDGWKAGYVHVMSVHPDLLYWRFVSEELRRADIHAQGGIEALNRALDADEEAWERQTDRAITNYVEAATSDTYDRLAWADGRRVTVPNDEPVPVRHLETERDGFVVRERRRTA